MGLFVPWRLCGAAGMAWEQQLPVVCAKTGTDKLSVDIKLATVM